MIMKLENRSLTVTHHQDPLQLRLPQRPRLPPQQAPQRPHHQLSQPPQHPHPIFLHLSQGLWERPHLLPTVPHPQQAQPPLQQQPLALPP